MMRFSVWGLVRRIPDGNYRVRVRGIPLADGVPFESDDELTELAEVLEVAIRRRDELAATLKRRIEERGDEVVSIDATFEV